MNLSSLRRVSILHTYKVLLFKLLVEIWVSEFWSSDSDGVTWVGGAASSGCCVLIYYLADVSTLAHIATTLADVTVILTSLDTRTMLHFVAV